MDETIPREEMTSPPVARAPWHERPVVLGLIGLALMVGGWKLSTYVPADPRVRELARLGADDPELVRRLREYEPRPTAQPPYQLAGRMVLFAGLLLFLYAAARMYRSPARREEQAQPPGAPPAGPEGPAYPT